MREIKFRVWDKHSKEMSVGTINGRWGEPQHTPRHTKRR